MLMLQLHFSGYGQEWRFKGNPFLPKIYKGNRQPPRGFNVLTIDLDLSCHSFLKWDKEIEKATQAASEGLLILFELNFAVQESLLEEEAVFLTHQLNIRHFIETIWTPFHDKIFGVSLFSGELTDRISWYLKGIAAELPIEASCFVFLDGAEITDVPSFLAFIDQERLQGLFPIIKSPVLERFGYLIPFIAWNQRGSALGFCSDQLEEELSSIRVENALCLPEPLDPCLIEQAIAYFAARPFRVIEQNKLHLEWEGVESLVVHKTSLNQKLERKLAGFRAAGGSVIMI